jgi:hypothetical protein
MCLTVWKYSRFLPKLLASIIWVHLTFQKIWYNHNYHHPSYFIHYTKARSTSFGHVSLLLKAVCLKNSIIQQLFYHACTHYSKTWLIQNSRDKKIDLWSTSIMQHFFKKLANNLLKKISITPINAICGHLPLLSQITISHGVVWRCNFYSCFGRIICYTGKFNFKDISLNCHFELFGENCMKIITTRQFFFWIMNHPGFRNNQVNLYEFLFLGTLSTN